MKPKRFIIQGYGNIGRRHAALLDQMEEAELVAVIDDDPEALKTLSGLGAYPAYHSLNSCLADGVSADVLNVCTPNGLHYEHASEGLKSGLHVLVEKPLTLTADACNSLINQAKAAGLGVYGVLQNRYSPPADWLNQVMEEERLGQLYMVAVHCFWNRGPGYYSERKWRGSLHLDGGPLYTQFSHFIDLLLWTLGPLNVNDAIFYNFNHQASTAFEDSGLLQMQLKSGAPVNMSYSTSAFEANLESSITIIGEKGSLKIGGQYMNELVHCRIADYEPPTMPPANLPNQYAQWEGSAANHSRVLSNLIYALNGHSVPIPDATEARPSIELIESAYHLRDQKGINHLKENRQ